MGLADEIEKELQRPEGVSGAPIGTSLSPSVEDSDEARLKGLEWDAYALKRAVVRLARELENLSARLK